VFFLPVPPTPEHSTVNPTFPAKYTGPVALTHTHAASGIQTLPNSRLLFTQSSFTSPNDVFIIHGLESLEEDIKNNESFVFQGSVQQVTRFTQDSLKGKDLSEGEEFWFKGAEEKHVQGWVLKPKGWKSGEKKRWPILLLIHGGVLTS
jgi:dipeptidyl aminopeptidase/acylaminoacyl peptidase